MKTIPLLGLSLVFLISCSHPKPETGVYQLDPKTWPTQAIALDDVVTGLRIIPLETRPECLIGNIEEFHQNDRGIFIRANKQIIHFDLSGKFIWKISRQGRGPGEYTRISGFTLTDKELILLDNSGKKILYYCWSGDFVKEKKLVGPG